MARSIFGRTWNTIRAFGGFDSSEVAGLKEAIENAVEDIKVPKGKEARDNLILWTKRSDPTDLGLGPVSRQLAQMKREALEQNAVCLDHVKLLSQAIKAARAIEEDRDPTIPEDVGDELWATACEFARQVENGVLSRTDAEDELHDEIVGVGEESLFQRAAEYRAAFRAARSWKGDRVRDGRLAVEDEELEALVGDPEARRTITRGLRAGRADAAMAHRADKEIARLGRLADSLGEAAKGIAKATKAADGMDEERLLAMVAKVVATAMTEAGMKKDGPEARLTAPSQG